jgi:hypothetical protein
LINSISISSSRVGEQHQQHDKVLHMAESSTQNRMKQPQAPTASCHDEAVRFSTQHYIAASAKSAKTCSKTTTHG